MTELGAERRVVSPHHHPQAQADVSNPTCSLEGLETEPWARHWLVLVRKTKAITIKQNHRLMLTEGHGDPSAWTNDSMQQKAPRKAQWRGRCLGLMEPGVLLTLAFLGTSCRALRV